MVVISNYQINDKDIKAGESVKSKNVEVDVVNYHASNLPNGLHIP